MLRGSAVSGGAGLELSDELRREWLRLVASLRATLHAAVEIDAPPGRLRELGNRAADLAREMAAHAGGQPVPLLHARPESLGPQDLNALLPFSPVMGRYNPLAPPVELVLEQERVVGRVRLREAFQGASGCAHGGIVSAIFDEILSLAALVRGIADPPTRVTVHTRQPTPLFDELRFVAWIEREKRGRVEVRATSHAGATLLAEAEGLWVRAVPASGWLRRST